MKNKDYYIESEIKRIVKMGKGVNGKWTCLLHNSEEWRYLDDYIRHIVNHAIEEEWNNWTEKLEVWLEAHDRQNKDFDTRDLLKYIRKHD